MKRENNLYGKIYDMENLRLADKNARSGKTKQYGVIQFDKKKEENLLAVHSMLKNKTYQISPYKVFPLIERRKERIVSSLPYMPDRIIQHAALNIIADLLMSTFTADTYSCIKKRGIHACSKAVKRALRNEAATKYCLKIDIKKFYPNIDHDILKQLLRRKIKDRDLLWLLDEIIDSADGVPIGNLLSQTFANLYLTPFDHWMKEVMCERTHIRYMDDMVSFADNKEHLHKLLAAMRQYLCEKLKLEIKDNYQIFAVEDRGVDMVGYVHYHTHTKLRPDIKNSLCRAVAQGKSRSTIASLKGWADKKHCNSGNLLEKLNLN
jgi:retron-type reverse transcriptase